MSRKNSERTQEKLKRLAIQNLILTRDHDWIKVIISPQDMVIGKQQAEFQEQQSALMNLKDNSFYPDGKTKLERAIAGKRAELGVRQYGGGTARVVKVNEFHDFPDVGKVNVRFTFNHGYGIVLTKKDCIEGGKVPMILCTGEPPIIHLMGWIVPDYYRQTLYKVHDGRNDECEVSYGFLEEMKDHECCHVNMQMLNPMWTFNMDLIK